MKIKIMHQIIEWLMGWIRLVESVIILLSLGFIIPSWTYPYRLYMRFMCWEAEQSRR